MVEGYSGIVSGFLDLDLDFGIVDEIGGAGLAWKKIVMLRVVGGR